MAASNKVSKDMIVVTFKEIPEYVTVETRHISKATAQQNNFDNVHYVHYNQGQIEFSPYDTVVGNNQIQNLRAVRPVLHSMKNSIISGPKTLTLTPLVSSTINAPHTSSFASSSTSGSAFSFKALPMPMNAPPPYNTTTITNFTAAKPSTIMPIPTVSVPFSNHIPPPAPFGTTSLIKTPIETKDTACMTDPKPIYIDQQQQFSWKPSVESIAIQCCIEDDIIEELQIVEDQNNLFPTAAIELTEEEEKQEFLDYVRENSIEYKNHIRECLICGEVCKRSKYFYGHMAVHRGPKCLCYRCGKYLENESMLKTHFCVGTKRENRALLRCPQSRCTVVAVSRLELYDHLNDHTGFRMHKCSACRKSFCTAQEFLRHLLVGTKCYTEAKRHRSRLYGLRTITDLRCRVRVFTLHSHRKRTAMAKIPLFKRLNCKHICELCFRSFRSKYIYHRHAKKCAALLRKRTIRKNRPKASN